jgi:cardiolipin synthase A/B
MLKVDLILWSLWLVLAFFSAGHALMHKRDPRAALGWIVVCLMLPVLGVGLYWLLGVNRIRSRAREWQARGRGMYWRQEQDGTWTNFKEQQPFRSENFAALLSLADAVTRRPILPGNSIVPLHNGEEAYPAMLAAIAGARQTVYLSTYIFDANQTGRQFASALKEAAERGVEVRVLVDALGERYSFPPIGRLFRHSKVKFVRFLPPSLSRMGIHLNLRNHRKLLVVDGEFGFAGGMNIGDRHLAATDYPGRVIDMHFAIRGPVVGEMQEIFLEDWHFATGEKFAPLIYPPVVSGGDAFCRAISAGPNEDFEKLAWILIGAFNCARHRIAIMTPYFIPERALVAAINAATLRGVEVVIILPEKNNLPFLQWASRAYLWEFLQYGTRVFYQPPPFVHSKLLLIDDQYALLGSANLDPRSLRLNFELNIEVYDRGLITLLRNHFDAVCQRSREVFLADLDGRSLPVKLRDALAKLFSPYL